MCGKFTQLATWREVVAFSQPLTASPIETVTPMGFAHVIHLHEAQRVARLMRWGFPDTGRNAPDRPKHIHARCETIDTLPTFADAFARRRGIVLVQSFNEGEDLPNGKKKQWTITPCDGRPLAIAVIWQDYLRRDLAAPIPMFAMATTPANRSIAPITDRMPALLREEDWALWLGKTEAPLAEVKALLRPYEDGGAWDVSRAKKPAAGQMDLFS
jgi:putative SOS response-associated peptidase YedK